MDGERKLLVLRDIENRGWVIDSKIEKEIIERLKKYVKEGGIDIESIKEDTRDIFISIVEELLDKETLNTSLLDIEDLLDRYLYIESDVKDNLYILLKILLYLVTLDKKLDTLNKLDLLNTIVDIAREIDKASTIVDIREALFAILSVLVAHVDIRKSIDSEVGIKTLTLCVLLDIITLWNYGTLDLDDLKEIITS